MILVVSPITERSVRELGEVVASLHGDGRAATAELRASDADRERSVDRLRAAAGDGQLTMEELDERCSAAYAATTRGELERLTADLQAPGTPRRPGGRSPCGPARAARAGWSRSSAAATARAAGG